jgi:hypothetical protein
MPVDPGTGVARCVRDRGGRSQALRREEPRGSAVCRGLSVTVRVAMLVGVVLWPLVRVVYYEGLAGPDRTGRGPCPSRGVVVVHSPTEHA